MYKLKKYTYWLIAWPSLIMFLILRGERKQKLLEDLNRFSCRRFGVSSCSIASFYKLMLSRKEFRNVFYMRLGYVSLLIKWFLPPMPTMEFGCKSTAISGGLFVEHGWAMVLDAKSVGRNLWINQGVTVGWGRGGHPTIGDNVRIGTGAVVIGGIRIGDNVNIGANAIVVEDVPDNCTVCSPKASIVKRHQGPTMNAQMGGKCLTVKQLYGLYSGAA